MSGLPLNVGELLATLNCNIKDYTKSIKKAEKCFAKFNMESNKQKKIKNKGVE